MMNPDEILITNTDDDDVRKNIGEFTLAPEEQKEIDIGLYREHYRSISSLENAGLIEVEINERRTVG